MAYMRLADFDRDIAPFTIKQEEGEAFTDDPRDPGGATKWGITLLRLREYRGNLGLGPDDVRILSFQEACNIAHSGYWNALRCFGLPAGMALMVFDHGFNAGPSASARVLQVTLGVQADGQIGPVTTGAARSVGDDRVFLERLRDAQAADYRSKSDFPAFGKEWVGDPAGKDDWHRQGRLGRRYQAAMALAGLPEQA